MMASEKDLHPGDSSSHSLELGTLEVWGSHVVEVVLLKLLKGKDTCLCSSAMLASGFVV